MLSGKKFSFDIYKRKKKSFLWLYDLEEFYFLCRIKHGQRNAVRLIPFWFVFDFNGKQ